MWVTAPCSVDAFWAASLMGMIHRSVSAVNPQVRRIAVTAPKEPETGYAPLISWRFCGSDYRPRSIRESEIQGLVRHLNWCASTAGGTGKQPGGTDLLMQIASSPGIQWEAVCAFVRHAAKQGFLTCSVEEALSTLTRIDRAKQPAWACERGLTRWKATKTLVDYGLLDEFVGRQRPLRPVGSTASLEEIRMFVAAACRLSPEDLTGSDRHAHIMHARHLAAAVMRRTTSRTLMEIGECLGQRDHATILNGLDRIEKWRRLDPMHSWLVESFAQIADNLGILKVTALRRMAVQQLEREFQGLNKLCPNGEAVLYDKRGLAREDSVAQNSGDNVIAVQFGATSKSAR